MSSVSIWILSIAGVICLSILLELIMPEGQMNKYIKNIFSFVIILVIILPLPNIIGKKIDPSSMFQYEEISLQEDYLYQINVSKLSATQKSIENEVFAKGYENIQISISADVFDEKIVYKSIYVNLKDLVITQEAEHKNIVEIKEDIKIIILKYIGDKEVCFEE